MRAGAKTTRIEAGNANPFTRSMPAHWQRCGATLSSSEGRCSGSAGQGSIVGAAKIEGWLHLVLITHLMMKTRKR